MNEELTPKQYYEKGVADRKPYEDRAEAIAAVSIPYLIQYSGYSGSSETKKAPSQSFNGRLISTLKSKMGMSLLPPASSSFRLEPDAEGMLELSMGDPAANEEIYKVISSAANRINKEIEGQQIRDVLFDIIEQLIAVGCVIMENMPKEGITFHPLKSFVVTLDSRGECIAFCIREELSFPPEGITVDGPKDSYELYTYVKYDNETGKWVQKQQFEESELPEEKTFTDDTLPYQYLGWNWMKGDKYHRPYADKYQYDMEQYDKFSKVLLNGSIVSSKVLFFVDQRGNRTKKRDVVNSANGDVIDGNAEDVSTLQVGKQYDFQVAENALARIGKNLSAAFLMNESVTRDAERVTAQEIRFMAQELESSSLSGVYSKLSKKCSKRIITWKMAEIGIKFDTIDIRIVTGLDALGRSQEAQKLDAYVSRLAALGLNKMLDEQELARRYASFDGIETTGLIKSSAQLAQERQQEQQAMAQQQMADAGASQLGQNAANAAIPQQ